MDNSQAESGIEFKDEIIICCDCGKAFTWSYGEQLYYRDRSLSPPRRCSQCRELRRKKINPRQNQYTGIDNILARAREEIDKWG